MQDRSRALECLAAETFDLLVIGAGVIGARVAYEAARTGARVALLDAGDFGGATSSASSKLIHGGLRYLQMGDFRLIRDSHLERRALLDRLAPHLVRPLPFVLPVYRGGPHHAVTIAAGLVSYEALSSFRHARARLTGAAGARRLVPDMRVEGLRVAGIYEDAQTHDSRLALAIVTAAARTGAVVLNHQAVTGLDIAGGRIVGGWAGDVRIRCRAVVNAAGPWVDAVRLFEEPGAAPIARLSKGAHLVLDAPGGWSAALTVPVDQVRVAFAVPWEGMLLLGTTDTEYEGDPAAVEVEPEDVETILREASIALPPELLARDRIRFAFAGLRVLPHTHGSTAAAPRDELIRTGPAGMVSVAGGKLTTHRRIAIAVLRQVEAFHHVRLSSDPLPGAGPLPERPSVVEPATWAHLTHLYGTEAAQVAALGLEPIHPDGPDVWGQVQHAVGAEWAMTVDDVARRRTTLAIRGLATPELRERIAATMSRLREGVLEGVDER